MSKMELEIIIFFRQRVVKYLLMSSSISLWNSLNVDIDVTITVTREACLLELIANNSY